MSYRELNGADFPIEVVDDIGWIEQHGERVRWVFVLEECVWSEAGPRLVKRPRLGVDIPISKILFGERALAVAQQRGLLVPQRPELIRALH